VVQEPTNRANGLTRDLQGRLIACEHDSRRVPAGTRRQPHRPANSLQGGGSIGRMTWSSKSDGCIYFTDPWTSPLAPEQWDYPLRVCTRHTRSGPAYPAHRRLYLAQRLAFSPDESVLYINTPGEALFGLDLPANGTLAK